MPQLVPAIRDGRADGSQTPPKRTRIDDAVALHSPRSGACASTGQFQLQPQGHGQGPDQRQGQQDFFEQGGWDDQRCNWIDIVGSEDGRVAAATRCPSVPAEFIPVQGRMSRDRFVSGRCWCEDHALIILEALSAGEPLKYHIDTFALESSLHRCRRSRVLRDAERR